MQIKPYQLVLGLIVLTGALTAAYRIGQHASTPAAPAKAQQMDDKTGAVDPATGKRVLYWQDPMTPGPRFDKPGKSPFMDMQLVPVFADEGGGEESGVRVDPRVQQNLGLRLAEVTHGALDTQLEVSGNIVWNEREQVVLQARNTGFIEKLFVRATFDRVAKGQVIAELYVPDWVAAQQDYLTVRRLQGGDMAALVDAARARMRQAGMSDEQIQTVEASGSLQPRITLRAPQAGVVTELGVREGMTVMAGGLIARINGSATVWANAEVPEAQAALVRVGAVVSARLPGAGSEQFKGRVQAILPDVANDTRTLKARVELANPRGSLAPGMFVSLQLGRSEHAGLRVPSEAVIRTGTRSVVMKAVGEGRFAPVEVITGMEAGGMTEIRSGLNEGDKVVVSGQFLVDSEASLRATATRLQGDESMPLAASAPDGDMSGHDMSGHTKGAHK